MESKLPLLWYQPKPKVVRCFDVRIGRGKRGGGCRSEDRRKANNAYMRHVAVDSGESTDEDRLYLVH